jgi:hypothetical protein
VQVTCLHRTIFRLGCSPSVHVRTPRHARRTLKNKRLFLNKRPARTAHTRRARSRKASYLYLVNAIAAGRRPFDGDPLDKARANQERHADPTRFGDQHAAAGLGRDYGCISSNG